MAETKMVDLELPFYQSFLPAIRALDQQHGPLYLAVVVQFEEDAEDEWTFLIGSRELDRSRTKGAEVVAQALADHAPETATKRIRRFGIISQDDPVFKAFTSAMPKRLNGVASFRRCNLFGLEVARAGVLIAMKTATPGKHGKSIKAAKKTGRRRRGLK